MKHLRMVSVVAWVILMCLSSGYCGESVLLTPVMVSFVDPIQLPFDDSDVAGVRIDILYGKCRDLYGLDIGVVNHATGSETGLAVGIVNYVGKDFTGLQIGVANYATRAQAFQIGVFNGAEDICGMQIGVINTTRLMRGCQLGLVNVIRNSDLEFLPVFNCFF